MNDEQKTPETTPDFVPGGKEPSPKVSNEDRAMLAEVWHDGVATQNALAALEVMKEKLEVQAKLVTMQESIQTARAEQLQAEMDKRLSDVMQRYNLPKGANVDVKTGLVTLPGQGTPAPATGGPPLVQVQPGATPEDPSVATTVPAGTIPQPSVVQPPQS